MKRPAVTYQRVSTTIQVEEGVSLEMQIDRCRDLCARKGLEIVGEFEDAGITGRSLKKRPGLQAAIAKVCETKGVLVTYSLSRMARSVRDAANTLHAIQEAGADLMIVDNNADTSTPEGMLIFNIFATIAEWESAQHGKRMKGINDHTVRELGYRLQGRKRYGYTVKDGKRATVESEQAVKRKAFGLRRQGLSLRKIAAALNHDGVTTRVGKQWSAEAVRRILPKR